MTNERMTLLHVSDLHIRDDEKERFDRSVVLDPFLGRLKKDREGGISPELVIVTGDITFSGQAKEYTLAEQFLKDVLKALDLPDDRLFPVPGNHDVARTKYRPSENIRFDNVRQLNEELGNTEYRADLLKGMVDYFEFARRCCPHLSPIEEDLVPFVYRYRSDCGSSLEMIGLNSAWLCRKSPDEREIAIGEFQIKQAIAACKALETSDFRLFACHHPLQWLRPDDRQRVREYLNGAVVLCGHLHDAAGGLYQEHQGRLYQFQAGCTYLGSQWPNRYQYVTFDWPEKKIELIFRTYSQDRGIWVPDSATGDDGKALYDLVGENKTECAAQEEPVEIPETYRAWLRDFCSYMDVGRLEVEGKSIRIDLPEVYIPLYAQDPVAKKAKETKEELAREDRVDVETLVARHDYLLIEGDAGGGKTTLLKHLAYHIGVEGCVREDLAPLQGYLPILISMKNLAGLGQPPMAIAAHGVPTMEDIVGRWCTETGGVLPPDVVFRVSKKGQALFLFDGLDEVPPDLRKAIVTAIATFHSLNSQNKIVLSGRPHGVVGPAMDHFGKKRVVIMPLDKQQVESFIRKWFENIYLKSASLGHKTAEGMISEIREHPATDELVENPLLLTAICMLYFGGRELPGQRAELYDKFVDNLLHRRFDKPEQIKSFLHTLAFGMHQKCIRGADLIFVKEAMRTAFRKGDGEAETDYEARLDRQFSEIEPQCGLIKLGDGQFEFRHLTFQEFLTALHIADTSTELRKAVDAFWGKEWYREVVELYVGFLSIKNRALANSIVADALEWPDQVPYARWHLAGRALMDVQENRRDIDVVDAATEKMRIVIQSEASGKDRADAGEILGRLGDRRDLESFVPVLGGKYKIEKRSANLKAFEISRYPVTNQWYGKFVKEKGYENKAFWSEQGQQWLDSSGSLEPELWREYRWNCPNAPVVGVCWWEADAFCRWLTVTRNDGWIYRLPTGDEWYVAAAGKEGRKYPWGNTWKEDACNTREIGIRKTSSVGVFPEGNTPEGLSDIAGNVWEWTEGPYEKDSTFKVLRGGSWFAFRGFAPCSSRLRNLPNYRFNLVGFRCARTR